MSDKRVYEAEVVDVFSGDDLIAMVDLGVEDLHKKQRIRLHGVDTPNAVGAADSTEAGKARGYVKHRCHRRKVRLTVISKNVSSWVAVVEVLGDGEPYNINEDLIAQGYAYKRERQA